MGGDCRPLFGIGGSFACFTAICSSSEGLHLPPPSLGSGGWGAGGVRLKRQKSALIRCAVGLLLLVGMMCGAAPGWAQIPSVLEEMTLVTQDSNQATFLLRFSPAEPQYAAVNNNPRRPELVMRATIRAPRIPQQRASNSLVRQIGFDNSNGDLLLRFDTFEPSRVKA